MIESRHKVGVWLSQIGLIVIGLVLVLVTYWELQPTKVLDLKNEPFPVRPTEVDQQEAIILTVDYCKLKKVNGNVVIRFIGQRSTIIGTRSVDSQGPMCQKVDLPILLPPQLANDIYHVEFAVTYKVNPIKQEVITFKSQDFTVKRQLQTIPD